MLVHTRRRQVFFWYIDKISAKKKTISTALAWKRSGMTKLKKIIYFQNQICLWHASNKFENRLCCRYEQSFWMMNENVQNIKPKKAAAHSRNFSWLPLCWEGIWSRDGNFPPPPSQSYIGPIRAKQIHRCSSLIGPKYEG
jgi:hypothetical protein